MSIAAVLALLVYVLLPILWGRRLYIQSRTDPYASSTRKYYRLRARSSRSSDSGLMKRDPLAYDGEVSAELQSTVRRGPLLVGFLVSGIVLILSNFELIFAPSNLYLPIVSISAFLLYFSLLAATWLRTTKAGPIVAWFKQRTEHVYIRFEDDDFVIRLPGKRESYKPSKLEWIDDRTLRISEGPTNLQLEFKSPDDARQIASGVSRICELQPKT